MAFEFQEPTTISICVDCVYFNAYGRLDDQAMDADVNAARKLMARIARNGWPWGTEFTAGCGSTCEEHGVKSIDFPDLEDWLAENALNREADYEDAREEAWRDKMEDSEIEPWFSWSPCEQCGSHLGGDREHATAWTWRDDTDDIPVQPREYRKPDPEAPITLTPREVTQIEDAQGEGDDNQDEMDAAVAEFERLGTPRERAEADAILAAQNEHDAMFGGPELRAAEKFERDNPVES